jgi:hypothetical protein
MKNLTVERLKAAIANAEKLGFVSSADEYRRQLNLVTVPGYEPSLRCRALDFIYAWGHYKPGRPERFWACTDLKPLIKEGDALVLSAEGKVIVHTEYGLDVLTIKDV